jgi:hypothetical protein
VQSCTDYAVYAIDHRITVTRMPAACQGLSKAQINGLAMATLGLPGRPSGAADVPARTGTAAILARGWVPTLLAAGHGLFAVTTLLLVLLAAIGAGAA